MILKLEQLVADEKAKAAAKMMEANNVAGSSQMELENALAEIEQKWGVQRLADFRQKLDAAIEHEEDGFQLDGAMMGDLWRVAGIAAGHKPFTVDTLLVAALLQNIVTGCNPEPDRLKN